MALFFVIHFVTKQNPLKKVKKLLWEMFASLFVVWESSEGLLPAAQRHGHREGGILLVVLGTFSFSSFHNS